MQEKITGKVLPETAEKTALRTVREILPETVPKAANGNKISDEYDSEKDRGSDRY